MSNVMWVILDDDDALLVDNVFTTKEKAIKYCLRNIISEEGEDEEIEDIKEDLERYNYADGLSLVELRIL